MTSRIFLTALELGVFEQLGTQQLTVSRIAQQLNADERALEMLLNALTGMGILQKQGNLFTNVKEVTDLLMPDSPYYQEGAFHHIANLWEGWSHLTSIIKSGQPYRKEWTDEEKRALALAMKVHGKSKADKLARLLDFSDANHMLDLGGGPGSYAIAFARRYPHLKVVFFDKDEQALKIARDEITRQNLQDRISLRKGDFLIDDIGQGYDLVLLSSVICLFGEERNTFLLRKVKESLKNGGLLVVWDLILDESKTKPTTAAVFAVNMLVTTQNGRLYSASEVEDWLRHLGFKDILRIPADHSQVIIGRRSDEIIEVQPPYFSKC